MILTPKLIFLSLWATDASQRIWDQLALHTLLSCSPGDWKAGGPEAEGVGPRSQGLLDTPLLGKIQLCVIRLDLGSVRPRASLEPSEQIEVGDE